MNVGSLFSGIAGIELGFEREGFKTEWFVENDPYCQAVLRKHWPRTPIYSDITKLDFSRLAKVDILTGGFPCQDISVAGKRKGIKEGARSSLWKYYAEAIGALRPRFALIENVPNILNLGLDVVLADLAEMRYDAEWFRLAASDFGALHRRQRIFVVAYPDCFQHRPQGEAVISEEACASQDDASQHCSSRQSYRATGEWRYKGHALPPSDADSIRACSEPIASGEGHKDEKRQLPQKFSSEASVPFPELGGRAARPPAYSECIGCERWLEIQCRSEHAGKTEGRTDRSFFITDDWSERIQRFNQETLSGKSGLSWCKDVRSVEELFQRPDIPQPLIRRGSDGIPNRVDRTHAIGNAVVPQVAQFIARRIREVITGTLP